MTHSSLLHMTAPLREDFDIPFHDLGDASQPVTLAATAGIHGNEINGVFVLARLADYLREIAEGKKPGLSLKKRVMIIPAVNVLGLNARMRLWPFDKTDVNRMFPGYDKGETTQRIAAAVLKATREASLKIDIHTSNLDFEENPHVRVYDPSPEEKKKAHDFGLATILESPIEKQLTVSLMQAWKNEKGESFSLRAGQAGQLQLGHCERLFKALVLFLCRNDILVGESRLEIEEDQHYFTKEQGFRVHANEAGIFASHLNVGRWLKAGDLIGVLYDSFTGKLKKEFTSPVGGLLLGLRRQPLIFQGDLIARIQRMS